MTIAYSLVSLKGTTGALNDLSDKSLDVKELLFCLRLWIETSLFTIFGVDGFLVGDFFGLLRLLCLTRVCSPERKALFRMLSFLSTL